MPLQETSFAPNLRVRNNKTTVNQGRGGGILLAAGRMSIANSVVDLNAGNGDGGAIAVLGATLALTESLVSTNAAALSGGGLYCLQCTLSVDGGAVANNTAQRGGGIAQFGAASTVAVDNTEVKANQALADNGGGLLINAGNATLNNGSINGNTAASDGGGVFNQGTLTLDGAAVAGNTATHFGGGLYQAAGTMVLTRIRITQNQADGNLGGGGGVYAKGGSLTLQLSTIAFNRASADDGGAIFNEAASVFLNQSTVNGNTARIRGGGVYNESGLTVNNSTISTNQADNDGGGIYNDGGRTRLSNVTVANNVTSRGSGSGTPGAGVSNPGSSGTVNLANTILAGNINRNNTTTFGSDCTGPLTSGGHNLIQASNCGLFGDLTGNQVGVDAMLGPLQNNGAATLTHALLLGSPAIDAGNNASCFSVDQRGLPRPVDGDGNGSAVCDIEAYEFRSCPRADVDGDRVVTAADIQRFANNWHARFIDVNRKFDLDGNGVTTIHDIMLAAEQLGERCPVE